MLRPGWQLNDEDTASSKFENEEEVLLHFYLYFSIDHLLSATGAFLHRSNSTGSPC